METRDDVVEYVKRHLGDPLFDIWTNSEIVCYIRQGYEQLVSRTSPLWKYAYVNDQAGVAVYDLPDDCLRVDRVTHDWLAIPMIDPRVFQKHDVLYRDQTGEVGAYLLEQDGAMKIRLWRVPNANCPTPNDDTNNTRIEYYNAAPVLAGGFATFDLPSWAVKYVAFFAMWKCLDRKSKGQNPKLAEHYRKRFEIGVARLKRRVSRANAEEIIVLGGKGGSKRKGPPPPRLPHNFGKVVRWYR